MFSAGHAEKSVVGLPDQIEKRVLVALAGLETQPRPVGCKKLCGENAWRIRIGDYRVIYEIHDKILQVIVVTVGHRREVYR